MIYLAQDPGSTGVAFPTGVRRSGGQVPVPHENDALDIKPEPTNMSVIAHKITSYKYRVYPRFGHLTI